jgi:topoisomerase IV subunit B
MADLFSSQAKKAKNTSYTAEDIEVLEGLEPVRRRPGMYIGGTDENALHHLVAEVFDNAMDEAVAGHASKITMHLEKDGTVTITDNGRGIPVDPHPKFPKKSALEVILTMLHSGGKFSGKVYNTSGGLHGVGISVVNALSEWLRVEIFRDKKHYAQEYSRGDSTTKLTLLDKANKTGTMIAFRHDPEIFGDKARFRPNRLYRLARSKAYLFKGVEIEWSCNPILIKDGDETPEKETLHFPNGIEDYLNFTLEGSETVTSEPFVGESKLPDSQGRVEWAIHWPIDHESFSNTYCNTIPTPLGGTHESGLRSALLRGIRDFGERVGNKKAANIQGEDILGCACVILSLFIREPEFQGQTKEKLVSQKATKLVETAVKDRFDHWLSGNPEVANALLNFVIERAEERMRRRSDNNVGRKSIVTKLRLPGKLADCSESEQDGTEIFLVEGDSAGGSAKQARNRATQAVLPLRGKILNVVSATADKIKANQEINDMELALGCGTGGHYKDSNLRYEKVVIMTDADVDGAHIATLLMTYFYQEMPDLIKNGHLYLAQPPLFRIIQGDKSYYARDEAERDVMVKHLTKESRKKIEVGRFKGLGEMTPSQLKETTMNPLTRTLLKVEIDGEEEVAKIQVEHLMGKNPELRFRFIQEQSKNIGESLVEKLDL